MIDICAFFEYTTDVSRGKMVTIYRKNLLASCLFLLGYCSFFLLAVSGSYDYTASRTLTNELQPLNPGKHRSDWLSNHEWDYSTLKDNYQSRRKSRSTLEDETSRTEEARIEEASQAAGRKWMPRRKRKFERFVGLESIENASGSVQEEKMRNTTERLETIKNDNSLENDTKKEVSDDAKTEKKDHLKDEVSVEEGKGRNATEILEFPSKVARFPTKLGQESLDGEPEDGGYPTERLGTRIRIPSKEFHKEILRRKHHRHRKGRKKGGMPDIEFKDSKDYDDEDFEEVGEERDDEDSEEEKEEKTDLEESSRENDQVATNVSSSATDLLKIISDVFLPMSNNSTGVGRYPWKALTSSRYTKEVTKQEGPNLKKTTKETKSKVSLFVAKDIEQTIEEKNNSTNLSKIDESQVPQTKKNLIERNESMETTTSEPIKTTTNEPIKPITVEPMTLSKREKYEEVEGNFQRSWVSKKQDENHDTIYHILDGTVLLITRILNSRVQPIFEWY